MRPARPGLSALLRLLALVGWLAGSLVAPNAGATTVSTGAAAAAPTVSTRAPAGAAAPTADLQPWSTPAARSRFLLPVAGPPVVLTQFRPPASRYGPGHRGVDLAAPVGGQVRAAADGIVAFAGSLAGRGVVSIDHAVRIRTTYEPVTAVVRAGDRVAAGQLIGTLQAGHASCAPASCLHWGARLPDGSYVDPTGLVNGLRVRLKPWAG